VLPRASLLAGNAVVLDKEIKLNDVGGYRWVRGRVVDRTQGGDLLVLHETAGRELRLAVVRPWQVRQALPGVTDELLVELANLLEEELKARATELPATAAAKAAEAVLQALRLSFHYPS